MFLENIPGAGWVLNVIPCPASAMSIPFKPLFTIWILDTKVSALLTWAAPRCGREDRFSIATVLLSIRQVWAPCINTIRIFSCCTRGSMRASLRYNIKMEWYGRSSGVSSSMYGIVVAAIVVVPPGSFFGGFSATTTGGTTHMVKNLRGLHLPA